MQEVNKETYYKSGDVINYRFNKPFTLKTFLGYSLKRVKESNKRVIQEKSHMDFQLNRKTNTEYWIAINGTGGEMLIGVKVPYVGLIDSFKQQDETCHIEKIEELYDLPDYITCPIDEFYSGDYNLRRINKEFNDRYAIAQNEIAFRFKIFDICKRNKVDYPKNSKSTAPYRKLCSLEILAFMLYQQRMYPTIKGFNVIQKYKKENPEIVKELKKIEENTEWVKYDKYKKTQSTERGS